MSMRYKGVVLWLTAPTTSSSSAVGIWTMRQQLQAVGGTGWPTYVPTVNLLGLLGVGANTDQSYGITSDYLGNIYITGYTNAYGSSDIIVVKYNVYGVIQWQIYLDAGGADRGNSITVDTSGNIYICGYVLTNNLLTIKIDSNGSIVWQKQLSGVNSNTGYAVTVDSSNNVYICGTSWAIGSLNIIVAKYNSNGSLLWQNMLGDANAEQGYAVTVDSSNNVYICGTSTSGTSDIQIAKIDFNGSLLWQRRLYSSNSHDYGLGIVCDSSGNVYVGGYSPASGADDIIIAKYNSSGAIQWQRNLGSGSGNDYCTAISIDSFSNIYVCGFTNRNVSYGVLIAKYNSSGVIQWQRTIKSSAADQSYSIQVNSLGNMYISGQSAASGTNDIFLACLPSDGSKTGTYSVGGYSFTYAASSLTDSANSFTDASTAWTYTTSSLTDSISSCNLGNASLTSSVTTI